MITDNCSSGVTMPLTFIKQDDDSDEYGSYIIQQPSSHHQQQLNHRQQSYGGMSSNSIKQELSSENSIISNFKNLQKNLELIEQQHMVVRQPTQIQQQLQHQQQRSFVIDDDDDDDDDDEEEEDDNDNDDDKDDDDDAAEGINQYEDDDNDDITLSPLEWDCNDVIEFLKRSNCSQHCELFLKHKIDGKKLMKLTQNDIIQLLGMKVGPAIKVFDMIQQIKSKVVV